MDKILKELSKYAKVETDVSFQKMTTLHIGGNAKYVVYPENTLSLDCIIKYVKKENLSYKLLGKGSNLLCSDDEYDGVVIRLDRNFNDYFFEENALIAQAGCSIISLSYHAMKKGLSGLEFASGIPGTVGGCVFMNAGAYKSSMSDIVTQVFVYHDGIFEWIDHEQCQFAYRTSIFQEKKDWIIIAAKFQLQKDDIETIRTLMDSRRERRVASQPLDKPSCGSVFRNLDHIQVWELIDKIGYRGKMVGGAKVSEKHCNFIVNENNATARDFNQLVEEIQQKIEEEFQLKLHTEVEKFNWKNWK